MVSWIGAAINSQIPGGQIYGGPNFDLIGQIREKIQGVIVIVIGVVAEADNDGAVTVGCKHGVIVRVGEIQFIDLLVAGGIHHIQVIVVWRSVGAE